jgi:hypothetical protein
MEDDDFNDMYTEFPRNKSDRRYKRSYFPSNGLYLRNAVTGAEYAWKSGSLEALQLFKMVDSTGTHNADGYKMQPSSTEKYPNPNPNSLYYESPEECMRHQRITFDEKFVREWHENYKARLALKISAELELATD